MLFIFLGTAAALQPDTGSAPAAADFGVVAEFARRVTVEGKDKRRGDGRWPAIVTGRDSDPLEPVLYIQQRSDCEVNSLTRVGDRSEISIDWRCGPARRRVADRVLVERNRPARIHADVPVITISLANQAPVPRPLGGPNSWVSREDYPAAALRAGSEGTVGFRLTVSPQGRATDCAVTSSSGSPVLDSATCALAVRRARFEPARDEKGEPTAASFNSRIVWRIQPGGQPRAPGLIAVRFDISPNGQISNCHAESRGGVPEAVRAAACTSPTSAPPPPLLAVAAPAFKSLVFVTSVSEGAQQFPILAKNWGKLLSKRSARIVYDAAGKPLACEAGASFGPGLEPCQTFPEGGSNASAAEPGNRSVVTDTSIFGVPR